MKAIALQLCLVAILVVVVNGLSGTWLKIYPPVESNSAVPHNGERKLIASGMPIPHIIADHKPLNATVIGKQPFHAGDITALTHAIKKMLKVLKHSYFVDAEVKELLEASRTFGLLLQESFIEGLKDTPEFKAFEDVKEKLLIEMHEDTFKFMNIPDNEESFVKKKIIYPTKYLQSLIYNIISNFNAKTLNQLDKKCERSNPLTIAKLAEAKLDELINKFINNTPTHDNFLDLKNVYTSAFKKLVAFTSICNAFHNEISLSDISRSINDTQLFTLVHSIHTKFAKSYWTTRRIRTDIITQIKIGGTNSEIAFNIFDELMDEYKDFGYTYHVGVSGEDLDYNNATLIYCTTECQYLNDYKQKNVYVLRNIDQKKYEACDFLTSLQNDGQPKKWCATHKKKYGDLRDLADEIIAKCKVSAFSIAINRYDYESNYDKKNKAFFDYHYDFPCYGHVHIAAVNNLLP